MGRVMSMLYRLPPDPRKPGRMTWGDWIGVVASMALILFALAMLVWIMAQIEYQRGAT